MFLCYANLINKDLDMTNKIFKTVEVGVDVTPKDLAEVFWEMNNHQQAEFFNHLGDISGLRLRGQMRSVRDSGELNELGRRAIEWLWKGVE